MSLNTPSEMDVGVDEEEDLGISPTYFVGEGFSPEGLATDGSGFSSSDVDSYVAQLGSTSVPGIDGKGTEEFIDDKTLLGRNVIGGVVTQAKVKSERLEVRALQKQRALINKLRLSIDEMQTKYSVANENWQTSQSKLEALEMEHFELNEQVESFTRLNINPEIDPDFAALLQRTKELGTELEVQRAVVQAAFNEKKQSQQSRDVKALKLHKLKVIEKDVESKLRVLERENKLIANYRVKREIKAAKGFVGRRNEKINKIKDQASTLTKQAIKQIEAAKKGAAEAQKRVTRTKKKIRAKRKELEKERREAHQKRAQAFLNLKQNTESALAELKGKNARAAKRRDEIEKKRKAEFDAILRDGGNPYEVFRKRELDQKFEREKEALIIKQKKTAMEIAERMIKDDRRTQKREAEEQRHRQYEQKYRDELGRHIVEERVDKYMKGITKDGQGMIDPTGRAFHVQPSSVTVVKDNSFGLGKLALSRPDVIEKVHAQYEHVKADTRGIPDDLDDFGKTSSRNRSVDIEKLLGDVDQIPGMDITINDDVKHGLQEEATKKIKLSKRQSVERGVGNGDQPLPPGKCKRDEKGRIVQRELTELEKKYMKQAAERQRKNIVKKQVVWGKEFTGKPFLSDPAEIVFKDFTVGKKMTINMKLTNISWTFNHFKVLSICDEYKDFFEITYTKPGRMSAGMTCKLKIDFMPK
eukprot:g3524.t1